MPSIVEGDTPDAFKSTYDILTSSINDLLHGGNPPPDPVDCINDYGQHQGEIAGRAAMEAQLNGGTPAPVDPMQDYFNATQVCAPEGIATYYLQPQDLNLPSLDHPVLTGIEVALTPTDLNVGEKGWLAEQNAPFGYQEHFEDGFTKGQIEVFDAHLENLFTPSEPQPPAVSPIDSIIPPLTVDPYDSTSTHNDIQGGSGSDYGSSGYGDGGSSSGDSSGGGGGGGSSDY